MKDGIDCSFIHGIRPHVLQTNQKLAPTIAKRRNERITAQYISQNAQTTTIAPTLDEMLNTVQQLFIVFVFHHFPQMNLEKSVENLAVLQLAGKKIFCHSERSEESLLGSNATKESFLASLGMTKLLFFP